MRWAVTMQWLGLKQNGARLFSRSRKGALAYLRTRLGIEAAERALSAYRDEHRSSMMQRASEAFRTISRGVYSRLDAQLTDKGEVLMGIGASGGAKVASEMSKGARFQLYLALRVAGYFEFVDQPWPGAIRGRRHFGDLR